MTRFSFTVLRNSTIGLVAQVIIKLLSFAFSVLVVRRLGAAQYGQYMAVLAFGAVFVALADLGLSPYTVRTVARLRDQVDGQPQIERLAGNVLWLRFVLAVLTAGLIIASAWLTQRPVEMIIAIALGTLGLLMYSVQGGAEALLAGYERLDITALGRIGHQLIFVLLGGVALVVGTGYYGLIFANLAGIMVLTVICWQGMRHLAVHPGSPTPRIWLTLIRRGIPFGIIGFTLGLSYRFDTILLNIFHGDMATGYYNAAYSLVFAAVMLSNVVNTALYPSLTREATRDARSLPIIYARAARYLLALSLPIAMGGCLLAHQIIPFLFKDQYAQAIPALRILVWVVPLMYFSEFLGYTILVDGREEQVARAVLISTGINIAANLVLVPIWGYLAAALMTVLTELILVTLYLIGSRHWLADLPWGATLGRPVLATAVMGATVLLLTDLPLLANVMIGATVYAVSLIRLRVLGRQELDLLLRFRRHTEFGATT